MEELLLQNEILKDNALNVQQQWDQEVYNSEGTKILDT